MNTSPFLGMRGTGDWQEGVRPESWREVILRKYPNGAAPLTAVMSMMGSEKTTDTTFHWFEQGLPDQAGAVTGIYLDPQLSTAVNGTAYGDGQVVYVKVAQATAEEFRAGHTATLENVDRENDFAAGDMRYEIEGAVRNTVLAGDNSFIIFQLHQSVDADYPLTGIDNIAVSGNQNEQGGDMPDAITYDAEDYFNYTQIFRTSLSLTRTAMQTKIRYGSDAYKLAKAEALELHAIELEKASIWGVRKSTKGTKGKPVTRTGGMIWKIKQDAPENIIDYRFDPEFAGLTWLQGGEAFLNKYLTRSMNYGDTQKLALTGNGAMTSINDLVRAGSDYQITSRDRAYGIHVNEWLLGNGTLNMKTHPLFLRKPNYNNAMLIMEPKRLKWRYIQDTVFIKDDPNGTNTNNGKDGIDEEWKTEGGYEYHNAETAYLLTGIGLDNNLAP